MSIFEEIKSEIVTIDETKDYLNELVGENKKFRDVESLARGKAESDSYIELLKSRLDEAQIELRTRATLEQLLEKSKSVKEEKVLQNEQVVPPSNQQSVSESDIDQKISQYFEKQLAEKTKKDNLDKVLKTLNESLGSDAKTILTKKASELSLSLSALEEIAASSPSAFMKLVGIEQATQQQTPVVPRGQITSGVQGPSVKNKAYYENLKKTNPAVYWDPKTTSEMIKSRRELAAAGIPW